MTYRRDIDGLRGLAVLLVVGYHAGLPWMQGGFVGVDVFFVISGYVIAGVMEAQFDAGKFRILDFYVRRFRRVFPAMLVVLAATLVAGLFLLGPFDLSQLATATIAVIGLSANFYFWRQRDYFADQAPPHALLHTWSLGVEEQFYLLFPLLLMLAKANPMRRRGLVFLCFAVSSMISVWLTASHPAAAFYLVPSRAWELCLGALIAMTVPTIRPALSGWLGSLGFILILLSAAALSGSTPYPGVAAFLPAIGAALVVGAESGDGSPVGRVLRSTWLWRTGLASYSVYLWHWPILTLSRHWLGRAMSGNELILALVVMALLSACTWRYVELRFRKRELSGIESTSLRWVGGLVLTLTGFAILTVSFAGFPGRLTAAELALDRSELSSSGGREQCHRGVDDFAAGKVVCQVVLTGGPRVLLWGDSHANALSTMLADHARRTQTSFWQATYSSCPPLVGVDVAHTPTAHRCKDFNAAVLESIRELKIERVILAGYWNYYATPKPATAIARLLDPYSANGSLGAGNVAENQQAFQSSLASTIRALQRLHVEVWIVDQVPVQREYVPDMIGRAARRHDDLGEIGVKRAAFDHERQFIHRQFMGLDPSIHLLDPGESLCASGVCVCFAAGQTLYVDSHHLSIAGAHFVSALFFPIFHR